MKKLIFILPLLTGCSLFNQHAQFMDAMRGVMADTTKRLADSGTGAVQAGGQVINPGIECEASMSYKVNAHYIGVAGQVQATMSGALGRQMTPEEGKLVNTIWHNSSLSEEQKLAATQQLIETLKKPATTQPTVK